MKTNLLILFLCISITSLTQTNNIDYYPIKVGFEWKYQSPDKGYEEKYIVNSFDNIYGAYLIKEIIKIGTLLPTINEKLLEKRNGKVLLLGTRNGFLNTNWKFSPEIVLEADLTIGKSWENETEGKIGDVEYVETVEYKVIDFSDVAVMAGEFKNVLILQITTSSRDAKSKKKKVFHKMKQYYAPNIGLIKTEVLNSDKNIYKIFTELVDYEL